MSQASQSPPSNAVSDGATTTERATTPERAVTEERFSSAADALQRLGEIGYMTDLSVASVVFLADRLQKPILAEGPAGTGKTELAKAVAQATGARLVRLQCYEGLDEAKALYEWNYKKQLLRIQAANASGEGTSWEAMEEDIFSEPFLLQRPLLEAIRAPDPVVLLVDEVDRIEVETEALLLEVLSDYQVSVPEMGTITASQIPMVFLTSNATRDLSEALKRRCLYSYMDYPSVEREREIIRSRIPEIEERLAHQVARVVASLRRLDLKKQPSVSETLDWARSLVLMGHQDVDGAVALEGLAILLKNRSDIERAREILFGATGGASLGLDDKHVPVGHE